MGEDAERKKREAEAKEEAERIRLDKAKQEAWNKIDTLRKEMKESKITEDWQFPNAEDWYKEKIDKIIGSPLFKNDNENAAKIQSVAKGRMDRSKFQKAQKEDAERKKREAEAKEEAERIRLEN